MKNPNHVRGVQYKHSFLKRKDCFGPFLKVI